jgi:hypothetical protein
MLREVVIVIIEQFKKNFLVVGLADMSTHLSSWDISCLPSKGFGAACQARQLSKSDIFLSRCESDSILFWRQVQFALPRCNTKITNSTFKI